MRAEWDVSETDHDSHAEIQYKPGYTETDFSEINIKVMNIYNLLKDHFGDTYEPWSCLKGTEPLISRISSFL